MKEKISTFLASRGETFEGEFADDAPALKKASRDASLFEVKPQLVVFPKNAADISRVVNFVRENKSAHDAGGSDTPLSITARSAGTCMSGGPLNESIILDITKHIHGDTSIDAAGKTAVIQPGTFYRDFEPETLKNGLILPCYTASKNLCTLGGMVANNSAGEKTLRYGKMENFVREIKMVFVDGVERVVKPLTRGELEEKMAEDSFEAKIYRQIFELIEKNHEKIVAAKPKVSKNSAGYYIWNVWDGETFDLTKLIVGSQGTLGIVTEATLKLVPVKPVSKLFVIFMPNISRLGELVKAILPFKPESLESYDDSTMKLAVKFLPSMLKSMKTAGFLKLIFSFLPEAWMLLTGGFPKLILLVEFSGDSEAEINKKMAELENGVKNFGFKMRATSSPSEAEKYWTIRRESFNLLRQHVKGRRTAPFVDDVVVAPEHLPEFLPKMRAILDEYKLLYTIAGHAGNGNFHIIPLMDMKDGRNRRIIREVSDKIYDLVAEYHGSITGEHNDGIIRTPYLQKMYGAEICEIFAQIKHIFDPQNIFNPGKKVGGTLEYLDEHLVRS
ncbi:MAG: FAD-binding oxidoreductase [Patescibacteria group bacterium]